MLTITVPASEIYNEAENEFIATNETVLRLEHSLVSISKWESKWKKPFLGKDKKTREEVTDYIKCMTLNSNISKNVYSALTQENLTAISKYINHPMTASSVTDTSKKKHKQEIITSELIYYWMVAYQIPFECEKWHINRLLMLIKICNAKNNPSKMSKREIFAQNRALNAARRKALHTKG